MTGRDYGFQFENESVFARIQRNVPKPPEEKLNDEFFVYIMGPYTAFNATKVYEGSNTLKSPFISDPLFDPERHVSDKKRGRFDWALADLCESLRNEFGVRAFLATDVDIPTESESNSGKKSMSVLEQSVAFSAVSDAVFFVFSHAGLTAGTGSEVGATLGEFHLREGNPEPVRKPKERFHIFTTAQFGSASIEEIPSTYGITSSEFSDEQNIIDKSEHVLAKIERNDQKGSFPVYKPYEV